MTGQTTVVIPNYNGIKFLKACLDALKGYPVIVVDNASTDGSAEFIRENYPEVKLHVNAVNEGFCVASNQGIELADTPYCFLLNNDTRMEKGCIEALETAIKACEGTFSVQAKMLSMYEPERIDDAGDLYCALGWAYALGKGKTKEHYEKRAKIFASCGGAVLYDRALFLKLGGFDERHFAYLEDMDLGYRARIHGYANYMEPSAVVYHAGSAVSGSRYNDFKVSLASRNSVYLFYKNMPWLQLVLNAPLLILGILIKQLFFIKKGMGRTYFSGILRGIKMSLSKEGRAKKTAFCLKNTGNYLKIQWELWWNLVRRVTG